MKKSIGYRKKTVNPVKKYKLLRSFCPRIKLSEIKPKPLFYLDIYFFAGSACCGFDNGADRLGDFAVSADNHTHVI